MDTTTATPVTRAPVTNPHRAATLITGWAVPLVVIGALWGAGHDPEHAEWSAFAIVAIVAVYLFNKVRQNIWAHRNGGGK